MANTTIFKDKHNGEFVQIHNAVVRNPQLSRKAKGMLTELLSYPNDWKITFQFLVNNGTEGKDAVRSMLKELEDFGHVLCKKIRTESGQFDCIYEAYETPHNNNSTSHQPPAEKNAGNKSRSGKPATDKPSSENRSRSTYNNTNIVLQKNKNKESEKSTRTQTTSVAKPKRKFGCYQNVLLTDEEYKYLCDYYGPKETDRSIESMSKYMAAHNGKNYTIVRLEQWIEEDIEKYGFFEPDKIPTKEEMKKMLESVSELMIAKGWINKSPETSTSFHVPEPSGQFMAVRA
ncbi:MAG: hypothetical protein K2J32_04055 [Ruminococcus sp.]|nr:hypothetical protein [Ruminococcus sp.]